MCTGLFRVSGRGHASLSVLIHVCPCLLDCVEHMYSLDGVYAHIHVAVLANVCGLGGVCGCGEGGG